ncbi:MAG: hypothetical protein ACE5EP_03985, partial [Candidatus Methylomirabilales bacterium]
LALDVGNPMVDAHFESDRVRKIGIFNPRALSLLRRNGRLLPHGSHWRGVWESLLTTALSIHMLHALFFDRFDDDARRYTRRGLNYSLDVGKISFQDIMGDVT